MATAPARYIIAGITDERDSCDCCGKTGLKRVVVLLDLDTDEFVFYGTTCADRNTGRSDTTKTARQRGKPADRLTVLLQHHNRKALYYNKQGMSILRMANGNANADTQAGAQECFKKAADEREKARRVQREIELSRTQALTPGVEHAR